MFKNKVLSLLLIFITSLVLQACASTTAQSKTSSRDDVVIHTISKDGEMQKGVKRQELESRVMRFADRYMAFMGMEAVRIMDNATTPEQRTFATGLQLVTRTSAIDIAIGPNAVENMLDMLVLVSLTREEIETYWVPEVLGMELGESLIRTSKILEDQAWSGVSRVLTEEQQQLLREMIHEWNAKHPDQHFFWGVRLSSFSGERAAELYEVTRTGGLLSEVQQTRESVEAIQGFGERVMYYLLRAPTTTRLEAEMGMRKMLESPELVQLLDNSERLTQSTERYATMLEYLPKEREAAFKQMFEELSKEREAAIEHMFARTAQEREEAIEHLISKQREALLKLLASDELYGAIDQISEEGDEIVNTTFIRAMILILIWVVAYVAGRLVYDRLSSRSVRHQ